jgi:hypothetical protein
MFSLHISEMQDPLFLSARIVDKVIVVSIVASLFFGQVNATNGACKA